MSSPRKCYTAEECAIALGMSLDRFYEAYEALVARKAMPASVTLGRYRIPKLAFDAWLNKDHPQARRSGRPANDDALLPRSQADHQAELAREYGRR